MPEEDCRKCLHNCSVVGAKLRSVMSSIHTAVKRLNTISTGCDTHVPNNVHTLKWTAEQTAKTGKAGKIKAMTHTEAGTRTNILHYVRYHSFCDTDIFRRAFIIHFNRP